MTDIYTMQSSTLPLVTAVITTFNRPDFVIRAMRSIDSEIYPNIECLVVEDNNQLPPDIIETMRQHTCRLVQHDNQEPMGVAATRNRGLMEAGGEYIIYLDDDDLVSPDRIASLVKIADNGGYDICYGLTRKHVPTYPGGGYNIPTYPDRSGEMFFSDLIICMPHINATLVRTQALRNAGGLDTATPNFDEWSAWLKILDRGGRAYFTTDVVADWFVHDKGLTGEVQREHSIRKWIDILLDTVYSCIDSRNRSSIEIARSAIADREINSYDQYADAVAAVMKTL